MEVSDEIVKGNTHSTALSFGIIQDSVNKNDCPVLGVSLHSASETRTIQ
jgi:hypothetical protein